MVKRTRPSVRSLVATAAVALGAAACTPPGPTVPAPSLPIGVGIAWLRDQGGTIVDDNYRQDLARFALLDGVQTGPAAPTGVALPATLMERTLLGSPAAFPDGTARQPWNGFAGEGVALTSPDGEDGNRVLDFAGGSCSIGGSNPFDMINSVTPSPDGSKAVVRRSEDGPVHRVIVVGLVDGPTCPTIVSVQFAAGFPEPGSQFAGNVFVWSPDSTAVAFSLRRQADGLRHIVQLAATPGAVPVDAVIPSSDQLLPLGWSVADRILVARTGTKANGDVRSELVTQAVGGGDERVLDTAFETANWANRGRLTLEDVPLAHYGYFVPGTTTVVYGDGSSRVTNSDGLTFPKFDVRLIADAAGAASKSVHGSPLPVQWHQDTTFDTPIPLPFATTDVPNVELVERFVR